MSRQRIISAANAVIALRAAARTAPSSSLDVLCHSIVADAPAIARTLPRLSDFVPAALAFVGSALILAGVL